MNNETRWKRNDQLLRGLVNPEPFEGVVKRLESAGWRPRVMETRRSAVRQLWLRARGLSRRWHSKHQDGLAMDVISDDHVWRWTPIEFMVELAFAAREEGLVTGLLWDMREMDRTYAESVLLHGTRQELVHAIATKGHGWDPCHCEERGEA